MVFNTFRIHFSSWKICCANRYITKSW